jgi:hypothetical protein
VHFGLANFPVAYCGLKIITKQWRIEGIFPHHVKEWQQQIITGSVLSSESKKQVTVRNLRNEIKALNKDLSRKNKALAETAARVSEAVLSEIFSN